MSVRAMPSARAATPSGLSRFASSCMHRIAIALAPDLAADADRHWYLRLKLSELQDWLGYDFPEVDAAIHWAKVAEFNHFRGLDEDAVSPVPNKPWLHDIYAFREHLRQARASAIEAATAGETTKIGSTEGESAVGNAETPKGGDA